MNGTRKLVNGYPAFAAMMGRTPELAILRRFSSLNIQDLLYRQAELTQLETDLRELEVSASQSVDGHRNLYARDWAWLERSRYDGDDEQWQLMLNIRSKLKEYSQ